jgi:hypothetical protein
MLCRGLEKNGMVRAGHGHGMASVNQTRPHCINQMGKTHYKPLAARHGRGLAWAWHVMCESAFKRTKPYPQHKVFRWHKDFSEERGNSLKMDYVQEDLSGQQLKKWKG